MIFYFIIIFFFVFWLFNISIKVCSLIVCLAWTHHASQLQVLRMLQFDCKQVTISVHAILIVLTKCSHICCILFS